VRVDEVEQRFRALATDLDTADAARMVGLVLDWYAAERVEGVDPRGPAALGHGVLPARPWLPSPASVPLASRSGSRTPN